MSALNWPSKRDAVELAQAKAVSEVQKSAVAKDSEIQTLKARRDKLAAAELAEAKLASGLQHAAATKDAEIQGLKAKLDAIELAQKLAITEALNGVERERDELKNGLARHCQMQFKETRAAHALR